MIRFKVNFKFPKAEYTSICLGKSKEELLNWMHPTYRSRVISIEEAEDAKGYKIGADHIKDVYQVGSNNWDISYKY